MARRAAAILEKAKRLGPQHVLGWEAYKRPDQVIPWDEEWETLLLHSGRGAGKTLTISHAIDEAVHERGVKRMLLVAPTYQAGIDINIIGDDGILACSRTPAEFRSMRGGSPRVFWSNGAEMRLGYAEKPRSVRGSSVEIVVCDEYAFFSKLQEVETALEPTMRIGDPRMIIATTPNMDDVKVQRRLVELRDDPETLVRQVPTSANKHLARRRVERLQKRWAGTTRGRQELEGEIIIDEGLTLWRKDLIEYAKRPARFDGVVISLDPNKKPSDGSDPAGIVVGGYLDGDGYILHAEDGRYSPKQLHERLAALSQEFGASVLLVEDNAVGDFFGASMQAFGDLPLSKIDVTATVDKRSRAYDALGAYEQGRIYHVGEQPVLEEQMFLFTGVAKTQEGHDDMVDALVHFVREFVVAEPPTAEVW